MKKEELYNAVIHIDEELLDMSEKTACGNYSEKGKVNNMSRSVKRILLPIAACLCVLFICAVIFIQKQPKELSSVSTTVNENEVTSAQVTVPPDGCLHNGNATAFGEEGLFDNYEETIVPDELNVMGMDIGEIKYLHNIVTGDPYIPLFSTPENIAERERNMLDYVDILGISPKSGIMQDKNSDYIAEYDDCSVCANTMCVRLSGVKNPITRESTDEEITDFIKNNKYMSALAEFVGVDADNAYILRQDVAGILHIRVCIRRDNAVDQSYSCEWECIQFLFGSKNAVYEGNFFGYKQREDKVAVGTASISYEDALKDARETLETDSDPVSVKIIYTPLIRDMYSLPCYQFAFEKDGLYYRAVVPILELTGEGDKLNNGNAGLW